MQNKKIKIDYSPLSNKAKKRVKEIADILRINEELLYLPIAPFAKGAAYALLRKRGILIVNS